jgi:hypothetical protein
MISTRQRGIYSIAHKKRAIVTNTIEKMMAKITSPKMVRLIATPCRSGSSAPAALSNLAARRSCCRGRRHLAHFTREPKPRNFGVGWIARYVDWALMPAGVIQARRDQPLHAQLAHVAGASSAHGAAGFAWVPFAKAQPRGWARRSRSRALPTRATRR